MTSPFPPLVHKLGHRTVEQIGERAYYSGFNYCQECGKAAIYAVGPRITSSDPGRYQDERKCACGGKMIPLLDSEVLYYLTKLKTVQGLVNKLRQEIF